jgi:hypothetical protein
MEDELEVIAAASAGAVAKDKNGDGFLQGPCPNCETELQGEYCWSCGQSAKDLKRPFFALFTDVLNAIVAFDGRLALTLPSLMFRPGHVTRAFLDGKRVRYVPPFRLFLIASILFFLTLFSLGERQSWASGDDLTVNMGRDAIEEFEVNGQTLGEIDGFETIFNDNGDYDSEAAKAFLEQLAADGEIEASEDIGELVGVLDQLSDKSLSRSEIFASVRKWAPRLSFLLLPIMVLSLAILHFWIRRIYIFDHVIVAMHLQTFVYLAASAAILFSAVSTGWAWSLFGISIPIYLFFLLRKSYDTNWFLNIGRIIALLITTAVAVLVLGIAVTVIGANEVGLFTWSELMEEWEMK